MKAKTSRCKVCGKFTKKEELEFNDGLCDYCEEEMGQWMVDEGMLPRGDGTFHPSYMNNL